MLPFCWLLRGLDACLFHCVVVVLQYCCYPLMWHFDYFSKDNSIPLDNQEILLCETTSQKSDRLGPLEVLVFTEVQNIMLRTDIFIIKKSNQPVE